jgi:tyrosyl-tRNA synthetase
MPVSINQLLERGVEEIFPSKKSLARLIGRRKIRLYNGVDPTGGELHLGHSVVLRKLRQFQDLGHEVIFLAGSFTAQIGDPSDRESLRKPLTPAQIEKNMATYQKQASKILDFSKGKFLYNADWLSKLTFEEVIKLSSHFTVQQMLERKMFQERLKKRKPIGLHEFLYPLMQGYDSVHMDVDLEVGGSDQTFNMLAGRTLQKNYRKKEKFVLTVPLLLGTDGRKMSKSYQNTVNLTAPANEMYGQLMSLKDELTASYLELCTDLPLEEVRALGKKAQKEPMEVKKVLAFEITKLYHQEEKALGAAEEFANVFQKGEIPKRVPSFTIKKASGGINPAQIAVAGGLAKSLSEAKRVIGQGGFTIDGKKITDPFKKIPLKGGEIIKVGKRRYRRVILERSG